MISELLIEVECRSSDNKYTELFKKLEIPRGLTVFVIYHITNKSKTKFSGTLKEIKTYFDRTMPSEEYYGLKDEKEISIVDLQENEKRQIYETKMQMSIEGNGWFECIVEPYNKEDEIKYFTNDGNQSLGTKLWTQPFKIINKEQLEIIALLKEIRDNTRELINKS